MKTTNLEAWNTLQSAAEINESGKLGFAIAKNMRKLADELKEYDAKRNELIQKYGVSMGDGRFSLSPENAAKFQEEMEEYDGIEFEFIPMTVSEEVFCSGNLNSSQMFTLMWMVEE